MDFLWLLFVPIGWLLIARFALHKTVSNKETGVLFGISFIIILIGIGISVLNNRGDTLILNGKVIGKEKDEVSCSHSYSCRCKTVYTGVGKNRRSHRKCDTCYEHSNDWDWNVHSTVGSFTISRIDRRGSNEPPRWTEAKIGEPASVTQYYDNYVKGAKDSLFNTTLSKDEIAKFGTKIVDHQKPYDYYRMNHIINVNSSITNSIEFNTLISEYLKDAGHRKQVNINLIFVKNVDRKFKEILERVWIGGKKNDVNIIYGLDDTNNIVWVDAFTFAKSSGNQILIVKLRDELMALKHIANTSEHVATISNLIERHFVRKEMSEFAYLKDESGISSEQAFAIIFLTVLALIVGTWYANKRDWFPSNHNRWNNY